MKNLTKLALRAKSPKVLVYGGLAFILVGGVWACVQTTKLDTIQDKYNMRIEKIDPDDNKAMVKARLRTILDIVGLYGPPIAVAGTGVAMTLSGYNLISKEKAALASAYQTLSAAAADYRQRVIDKLGEEEESKLRFNTTDQVVVVNEDGEEKTHPAINREEYVKSEYRFFFGPYLDKDQRIYNPYWEPDMGKMFCFLKYRQNYWNDELHAKGVVYLNDVIRDIGFNPTEVGSYMGWIDDPEYGDAYIDFGFEKDPKMVEYATDGSWVTRFTGPGGDEGFWLEFNVDDKPLPGRLMDIQHKRYFGKYRK